METPKLKIVQCWDDGVSSDIRLIDVLRRYGARASFNLNMGLHPAKREAGWDYKGHPVVRMALGELRDVYDGFTVANHSLTHPHLEKLPEAAVRAEVRENKQRMEDHFGYEVKGFAYSYGTYDPMVMRVVEEEGHGYARTVGEALPTMPPASPYAFHPSCKFDVADFWIRYEAAKTQGGVFYFWGHSYELISEAMWEDFEEKIKRMNADPESEWTELVDLFSL